MDESLERIIRAALEEARANGRDYLVQTEAAVAAVRQVRPDLTASEILAAVRRLQRSSYSDAYGVWIKDTNQ